MGSFLMKKFIFKYSLEMLSVFLTAEFIVTMIFRSVLSPGRIITGVFALLIMLHEWEETRYPGGFFQLMGRLMGIDLTTVNMGKCHLPTKILIFAFAVVPMIFDQVMVLVCVPIILMLFEMFIHIAGIFIHKLGKPYTPGLVTAIFMGITGICGAHHLIETGLASASDILLAIPAFFVCFWTMGFCIIKLIGLDFKQIRANVMARR